MYNVIKKVPRDWYDVENDDTNGAQDSEDPLLHDIHIGPKLNTSWCREDLLTRQILIEHVKVKEAA